MPDLTRRTLLRAGGGISLAALLSGCSTPVAAGLTGGLPTDADVVFWHLFSGGDGTNMATMVADYRAATGADVESTLLTWGNPYYTKLSLAASGGSPPDVGVCHVSRLPLIARAGLLEDVTAIGTAEAGITAEGFTPAAWEGATVDGTVRGVPLDTHPFVLFYNTALAEQAGLLGPDGSLVDLSGSAEFVDAVTEMRSATGEYGAAMSTVADPATVWRWFMTVYGGIGPQLVSDDGTEFTGDTDAVEAAFEFMASLTTGLGLMPATASATTAQQAFAGQHAGFLLDGVWSLPTYQSVALDDGSPLPFDMVPFPALLGEDAVCYADSHTLVVPTGDRSAERTAAAVAMIRGVLDRSATWAGGGHVPAWLAVQESAEFQAMSPQRNYLQAAFEAVYDPPAWYTGAGSTFQTTVGGVISTVLTGDSDPATGTDDLVAALRTFTTALPPV